ncbi:MAG: prolyl oligopeptidase family serine peptidase [Candidatus Lokiarchaeota archaeon]|nr:prolyl oligopeptidase family serine peptidase [Candidatus Lokiarchaeota archaeon]MBD3341290.1 prolyl oligopeptidase family serine peptidase [Candidatus Lokiarchaeota archaeon]
MNRKSFTIPNRRDMELHAIHYLSEKESLFPKKEISCLVIFCHGFTGDKYEWGRFTKTAEKLSEIGIDSLLFDFSGSGENEREYVTLTKQCHDLKDVYNWAINKNYIRIGFIGLSFGGLTVLGTDIPDIKTIIFWAPAFSIRKLFNPKVQESLKKTDLKLPSSGGQEPIMINHSFIEDLSNYDVDELVKKFSLPTLIIQGTRDRSVRLEDTRRFFKQMPQDDKHKLIEVPKATHNFDGEQLDQFIAETISWLKEYLCD